VPSLCGGGGGPSVLGGGRREEGLQRLDGDALRLPLQLLSHFEDPSQGPFAIARSGLLGFWR